MTKVLVVDDDPDLAAICSLVLESEGYDTEVASNGVDAYQTLVSDGVDVVLLDVMMPVMDCLTVCKMVKRNPKTSALPVIIMSASQTLRDRAHQCAADAVLDKPFDIEVLLNTVGQFALHSS